MIAMEGPLFKWTNMMKGYQPRWFVLDDVNGLLSYYTSQEKLIKGDRRGCIRLKGAIVGIEDEDDTTFTISADGKIFHCKAHDSNDRDKWINSLQNAIEKHAQRRRPRFGVQTHKVPTIEEFNKKLTETDSYLQILINQFRKIDDKLTNAQSDIEKAQLTTLKEQSGYLLDSIKHTIVLLQIAKNVQYPVNGVLVKDSGQTDDNISDSKASSASGLSLDQSLYDDKEHSKLENENSTTLVKKSIPVDEMKDPLNQLNLLKKESRSPKPEVPDVSYASSDDEDFFFDAPEDSLDVNSPDKSTMNLKNSSSQFAFIEEDGKQIDYDRLYDSDSDGELDSMQSHGSVISHLISQVKIGMDLTKVALPTFILERRSLLEMYADFFAHADIFVSIPDYDSPHDRMIQVVRWYLSAFHAGRKSSVAKKPYNPILGEVFKCHWNLPKSESTTECNDGPVPAAKTSDLTFIAEQVSHHPPISAFYAESINKRIMCSAHIWTKSKFLGLSIGVNNLGLGSIYLLDHGEEYTCTFPSAYGRSILTEPWFEMGGLVEINCQQTGYYAKIEFLTKPFYGGKKHRINAEVYGPPPTKKLIVTISGEWNGQMQAKWANSGKSELFVDTKTLPIIKKQVAPISQQEEFESRNIWKVVTAALKRQDVSEATSAKYAIEQQQRTLVKEREEQSHNWQNRAFHCIADKWCYNNPLTNRQKS